MLALRAPLLVIVLLAFFYLGASLPGKAIVGPIMAALLGVAGLAMLALTLPLAWIPLLGLVPLLLGWTIGRLARTRRPEGT